MLGDDRRGEQQQQIEKHYHKKVEHKQQRQSYNKFSKDFKNGPCVKKGNFKKFVSSLLLSFMVFWGFFCLFTF